MKSAILAMFFVSACLGHATLVGIKTTREHHIAQSTTSIAIPSFGAKGSRLSEDSHDDVGGQTSELGQAGADDATDVGFGNTSSNNDVSEADIQDMIVGDPSEVRYNSNGKISFSHFQRIAFLGKTVSRLYNFVAKLFPTTDTNTSDAEQLAKSFNSLQQASQVFYTLYYDSKDLGVEIQQLFDLARSIDFSFRDGLALFGFDKVYSDIANSQNVGDELFKTIKRGIEQDIEDFRVALSKMLDAIENMRNPHKFLYSRLKRYEDDYTDSGVLETDNDKIAQGKKMLGVFQNLKSEFDQMGRDVVSGGEALMQTRTKMAVKLKKLAKINTMDADSKQKALGEFAPERELVAAGTGRLATLGLAILGLWLVTPLGK